MRVHDLPRRRYSMPETVMRKYRLRQRAETSSESSSAGGGGRRRRVAVDKCSQTSPRESIGRTGSYPSLATPSPRAWSCPTSDYQTVSDKTVSTQDSTLSVPSTNSEFSYRCEDVQTQVSLPERVDRKTSMSGLHYGGALVDIAVSIETMSDDTVVETDTRKDESVRVGDESRTVACQADNSTPFKLPEINVMKDSTESQSGLSVVQVKEESSQVCRRDIMNETEPIGYHARRPRAEVACVGANYDEYPIEKPVVPRYSAIPRTNSMLVNTSSVEYTSDSELSLTDSLEDPEEYRSTTYKRRHTRHDERLVRGEVSVEQERRRLPKGRDAYAYFLSMTGEEETIREYSIPDWLRERLRRREEEIKKVYEDKLNRHQYCGYYRRRKKPVKRFKQKMSYSSSDKVRKNDTIISDSHNKNEKTVHFNEHGNNNNSVNNNNINPGVSDKCSIRTLNGNNMGLVPKIDNIHRNNNNHNVVNNNNNNNNNHNNGGNSSQLIIQPEPVSTNNGNPNLLQISEVIKIEVSENATAVITKEKQINLTPETRVKQSIVETVNNSSQSVIKKSNGSQLTAELVDTNTIRSSRQSDGAAKADVVLSESSSRRVAALPKIQEKEEEIYVEKAPQSSKFKEVGKTVIEKNEADTKIELDRTIADILITALEENTKAHQYCRATDKESENNETTIETYSKIYVDQKTKRNEKVVEEVSKTIGVQTDDLITKKEVAEPKTVDRSSNTEPYLVSVRIQTSDRDDSMDDVSENSSINSDSDNYEEDISFYRVDEATSPFETSSDANMGMVDKACNTFQAVSISTQTTESMLQSKDIVNEIKKVQFSQTREVQFPPQVIRQIITGTGEYKTIEVEEKVKDSCRGRSGNSRRGKVSRGTNTEEAESAPENNKNIINSCSAVSAPTPFCKNVFPSKGQQQKNTQVLELNVPACTCHMCTLQKISPRSESKSRIPQTKKNIETTKDEKKSTPKVGPRRINVIGTKFKMFEVIPEEKTSSNESNVDESLSEMKRRGREEKAVLTEPHLVDRVVQVGSNIASVATNTDPERSEEKCRSAPAKHTSVTQTDSTQIGSTQTINSTTRKSNLVIGRFRPENRESPMLVRQYKGRASLSAGPAEGQEELLTLSKGWINFYLLKDNLDFSDSNTEEPPSGSSRRRVRTIEKEEDKVEEYTVEIHATPEPSCGVLPNFKRSGGSAPSLYLPEIQTSSSSSTPDCEQRKPEKKAALEPLPGVRKSKKTRRSQINMKREDITETRRNHTSAPPATRAVEVARSEQSISSITSSTVILSESPPPPQLKLPEKRNHRNRVHKSFQHHVNNGSSWTVTVAGSSGSGNDPPPDVEMKLSFGKQGKKQEENMLQYQVARPKRQGRMIEEFSHVTRNEKRAVQCIQDLSLQAHYPKSSYERTRGGAARDNFCYEEDYINRLSSRRSRYSTEDGSETAGDLQVTGLAITPEKKPRVPTQSERDILRPQRYKFTR